MCNSLLPWSTYFSPSLTIVWMYVWSARVSCSGTSLASPSTSCHRAACFEISDFESCMNVAAGRSSKQGPSRPCSCSCMLIGEADSGEEGRSSRESDESVHLVAVSKKSPAGILDARVGSCVVSVVRSGKSSKEITDELCCAELGMCSPPSPWRSSGAPNCCVSTRLSISSRLRPLSTRPVFSTTPGSTSSFDPSS